MLDRRRYRKVFVRLWNNPEFRALPDGEKVMTIYLFTGPQTNRVGLFPVSFGRMAEDINVSLDTAKRRFGKVCKAFGWQFDPVPKVLWIPSWWSFNAPSGDQENNWKGCLSDLNEVPRTQLIHSFCKHLVHVPSARQELFTKWESVLAPSEQGSNSVATQEKEQEQEQEQDSTARAESRAPQTDDQALGTGGFIRRFCELYAKYRHGARYHVVPSKHVPLIRRLLRTYGASHLEKLTVVLLTATADDWLNGTDRGIEILHSKVNWLEERLKAYEAKHGEIRSVAV